MPSLSPIYKLASISPEGLSGEGALSGYGSVFHFLDWHNDIIAPGAYLQDIARFMSKGFIGGLGHDHDKPIGRPTRVFEDSKGLYFDSFLDASPESLHARQKIKDGIVKQLSVGLVPLQARHLSTKQIYDYWAKVGWEPTEEERMRADDPDGATLIKRARILEISPVAAGANDLADITAYKSFTDPAILSLVARVEALESKLAAMCAPDTEDTSEFECDMAETLKGFRKFLGES